MNIKFFFFVFPMAFYCQQSFCQNIKLKVYGIQNKTERIKNEFFNSGINLIGYDSKKGYQIGLQYDQFIYKKLLVHGELGFLNKGHNANDPRTGEVLYSVNYNYVYLKPSLGYYWKGFTLSSGLFLNFLAKQEGLTQGKIEKLDIAYSFELAYNYKRFGIQTSLSKSIRPMQTVTSLGITYEHYHRWLSLGLSYALYQKKEKKER